MTEKEGLNPPTPALTISNLSAESYRGENTMKSRGWLSALAVSAGGTTFAVARADITGSVKLDGKAPEQKTIDMAADPDCNKLHADPVQEQTIVADDKGDLKFVVVSIKPDEGQNLGGQPRKGEAFVDQQG